MLAELAGQSLPVSNSLLIALCGMAIVMLELIAIAFMIIIMAKVLGALGVTKPAAAAAPAAAPVDNTADEIQAVIMATISEDMQIPLKDLDFKSIKPLS